MQILERIGTPEATRLLERLAQGLESASVTRAAKDALGATKKTIDSTLARSFSVARGHRSPSTPGGQSEIRRRFDLIGSIAKIEHRALTLDLLVLHGRHCELRRHEIKAAR